MNKNLYRIIFNSVRGVRMAVQETASGCGKASGATRSARVSRPSTPACHAGLKSVAVALLLGWASVLQFASLSHAQIAADASAPGKQRPTVLTAPNGVPLVNIQTPSAAGVSRNTYSQFDVNAQGAILNNARNNAQTQLGGWVQGNPWLAGGPARVILNEVNSSNPSQLRGFVEIAGSRAEVVIANPAGVNINGGGFINASRATITTGAPVMNGGNLEGYVVQKGLVRIDGAGLDASQTDYTGIIARAVEVNAGIWAKELKVTTGANEVDVAQSAATAIAGSGAAPAFALDVSQLGGMYAGKITLVGTEAGLGVRNAGTLGASAGNVVVQANGWLTNSGSIQAAGNTQITTDGATSNSGVIYATGNTSVTAQGGISTTGTVAAQGNTTLQAVGAGSQISAATGSVIAAGLNPDGTLSNTGALNITASNAMALNGQTLAGGDMAVNASQISLAGGHLRAQNLSLTASTGSIDASRASVTAQGGLSATAAQLLRTDGASVSANQLNLSARDLSNAGGEIIQTGTGDTSIALTSPTGTIDNTLGRIATNAQSLTLSAQTLGNTDGKIEHAGTGTLGITTTALNDQRGQITSNGVLDLQAGNFNQDSASTLARQVKITAAHLSNLGGEIVQTGTGAASIVASGTLDNTGGKIVSNGDTRINAQSLNNQGGLVQTTGTANLGFTISAALDNSAGGQIAAGGSASADAGSINNDHGKVTAGAGLGLTASQALDNSAGLLAANSALTVAAASLNNAGGTVASVQSDLRVTTVGATINNSGKLQAAQDVTLNNAGLSNVQGTISGQTLIIQTDGQAFNNRLGTVAASGSASVQSGALNNDGGLFQSAGAMSIDTGGKQLTNSNAGSHATLQGGIRSQGSLMLTTGDLSNSAGFVGAKAALTASTTNVINNAGGQVVGESSVSFTSAGFDNRGGQVQSLGDVSISAGSGAINNTASLIRSAGTTTLTAASVINSNTLAADHGIEGNNVAITGTTLSNDSGAIRADNNAVLTSSGTLNNAAGLISAGNVLTLQDNAASKTLSVTNTGGTALAAQSTVVSAASLTGDGKVLSKGVLSIDLLNDFNNTGEVIANGNASIVTQGQLTNSGKLQAGATLDLSAANVTNTASGEIVGAITKVVAANALVNRGLIDGQDTQVSAATLNNLGTGRIYGDHVAIAASTLNNLAEGGVAPVIAARNRLDIGATTINNSEHALLFSGGDMAIGGGLNVSKQATGQASALNNGSATIEALGNLSINAAQINNSNNHFSTQVVAVSSSAVTEYEGSGSGTRYLAGTPGLTVYNDESDQLATPDGGRHESWSMYQYTRSISETVVAASDPGQILSGGSMTINASNVVNDKSRVIAGGALTGSVGTLNNTEAAGERVTTDAGSVVSYWRNHKRGRDDTGSSTAGYSPADSVQAISLTPTVYQQNTAPSGSGTQVAAISTTSVSQNVAVIGRASASVGGQQPAAPMTQVVALASNTAGGPATVVRTGGVNFSVPNNSLFKINTRPSAHYLVETDARFANYRNWLSSDFMLQQLSLDPTVTQKRLGDGFYEQKLIREQVAALTGRRFLDGYASDEAQYQALMTSGATFAQAHQLVPGIALSAAQMAQLTSDIVWLVEREVALPDGTIAKVLVPQLYARVRDGDLTGDGALLSAGSINLNIDGDLTNSGTIAGRSAVVLNAQNVQNLAGRIRGADVTVAAANDLNNIGGQIIASDSLVATAGRDLNIISTTRTQTSATGSMTNIDRVAGLYVTNPGGTLVASAGRDINLVAAELINNTPAAPGQPAGSTTVMAGRDLNLGTVIEASNNSITWDANNFRKEGQSNEVGSSIHGSGNVTLSAGNDLNARAAQITSSQGALTASAGNNVNITAGQSSQSVDEGHQHTSKGFLSKKTITTRETMDRTDAVGSSLSGNTVTVLSGKDINVKGSSAVSDSGTTLVAGNNLTIEAAQNTSSSTSLRNENKSGIFSSGGLSITAGKQQQSTDQQNTRNTAAASTVGSIGGDVTLQAGNAYKQVGSDLLAPSGDISISARKVDIIEARETSKTATEQKFTQSGLTLAITAPVITALQTAQQMSQAAGQTSDGRMQSLAAATTALAAKNAYDSVAADPAAAGGLNISITVGGSKNQSTSTASSDLARGSTVAAGGDVSILASGAGKDSDILVRGSTVQAGKNAILIAEDEIKLLAAANNSEQNRSSSGSSGGIGVAFTVDSGGIGFGITANASASKGKGEGQDTSWTNTRVEAGKQLSLISGGDTTLKGAVAKAETVLADVGGNLNIESLQDTSTHSSKDQSLGGSVTVGIGFSGSVNASQQKINSDFASVMEQSGIKAGDGGFDVNVMGNTDLKGAVIVSTDEAVQDGKNTFTTGTLTQSEIQNKAEYNASSMSLGGGYSDGKGLIPVGEQATGAGSPPPNSVGTDADGKAQTGAAQTPGSTLPGYNGFSATIPIALSASGNASTTTGSGISAGAITISDEQKQKALTGQSAAEVVASIDTNVRSDKDGGNALKPIFNEQEIKAGFEITGALTREAGTFLRNRAAEAEAQKKVIAQKILNATDPSEIESLKAQSADLDKWGSGGTYQQIGTAFIAAAAGNVTGSSAQIVQAAGINYLQSLGAQAIKEFADSIDSEPVRAALHAINACAGAAAQGTGCASGAAGAGLSSLINSLLADAGNATAEQKAARSNLLAALTAGVVSALGGDAAAAGTAARIETENNALYRNATAVAKIVTPQIKKLEDDFTQNRITPAEYASARAQLDVSAAKIDALTTIYNASDKLGLAGQLAQMQPQHIAMLGEAVSGLLVLPGMAGSAYELLMGKSVSGEEANYFFAAMGVVPGAAFGKGLNKAGELAQVLTHLPSLNAGARIAESQARGVTYEKAVIQYLDETKNTTAFTAQVGGKSVTVIPDAALGSNKILEVKDVIYLTRSPQFRAYEELVKAGGVVATGAEKGVEIKFSAIELVVSPNTRISGPVRSIVERSGGSIREFDSVTKTMKPWNPPVI